jgi:hypothetical protein
MPSALLTEMMRAKIGEAATSEAIDHALVVGCRSFSEKQWPLPDD